MDNDIKNGKLENSLFFSYEEVSTYKIPVYKYMHQYKQKRWKYFGFVAKINFFLLSLI